MSDNNDIEINIRKALGEFRLGELEAKVYLYLLGGQAETVVNIARALGAKRTSVYDALAKLGEKRLVENVVMSRGSEKRAVGVQRLAELVEEEKQRIEHMSAAVELVKKQVLVARLSSRVGTEVRYFEGTEGMKQMIWNCLKADKQGVVGYSVFGRVAVVGERYYQRFVEEFGRRNIKDKVISNDKKETLELIGSYVKPTLHHMIKQNIRVLPESKLYVAGDTMIYNDTYAVSYWQEGEVVGVEIESPEFVRSQRTIFEILWEMAEEI